MSIISRFDDLEKCSETAERSGTFKADRNRLFGKRGPLQQLCAARQANFPLVPVDFGNAELGQLLRDHVRVRFQRRNGVGGRKGIELAASNRLENLLEFLGRDFFQSLLKRARDLVIGVPALLTWQIIESRRLIPVRASVKGADQLR